MLFLLFYRYFFLLILHDSFTKKIKSVIISEHMRESRWFSLKRKNIFVIGFDFKNRILFFLINLVIAAAYVTNKFVLKNEISALYEIILASISLLLLLMTLVVDNYKFDFIRKKVIISNGIFPIVIRRRYFFQEIKGLKIEPVEFGKKKYYELVMILKSGKTKKLGAYKDVNMLNHYLLDFKYYKNDGNLFEESDFLYM